MLNHHVHLVTYLLVFKYWKERERAAKYQTRTQIIMRRKVLPAQESQSSLKYRKELGTYFIITLDHGKSGFARTEDS